MSIENQNDRSVFDENWFNLNKRAHREGEADEAITALLDVAIQKERAAEPRRTYIGASMIGGSCIRNVQYEFMGVPRDDEFTGRILRIFQRGHWVEAFMRRYFQLAGFDLRETRPDGRPLRFKDPAANFSGGADGCFHSGPAIPGVGYPCLWECKGLKASAWKELGKNGLRSSKPTYYGQVSVYQAAFGLTDHSAIFTAVNMDTMEPRHLLIPFDPQNAQEMIDRAVLVYRATEAGDVLPRPYKDDTSFVCRLCDRKGHCWSQPQ